jgi:hypothetical protein
MDVRTLYSDLKQAHPEAAGSTAVLAPLLADYMAALDTVLHAEKPDKPKRP